MFCAAHIRQSLQAALPIMLGYVAIGIPAGILGSSIGLTPWQVLAFSVLFYSGAGQFMIPNMYLAGSPLASIIASVSFVNTRQMLYATSLAPFCRDAGKRLSFFFAATVTDESYGVNIERFATGDWSIDRALMLNLFSQSSWALSSALGAALGSAIGIPLAIASFAMTSIFICLLFVQNFTVEHVVAAVCSIAGVVACKCLGLTGPAILIGAVIGVLAALGVSALRDQRRLHGAETHTMPHEARVATEEAPHDER